MAATATPPANENPAAEVTQRGPVTTSGAEPEPKRAEPSARDYAVYEVVGGKANSDGLPIDLKFVAVVTTDTKDAARWAAVDQVPALAKRVAAKDGASGEQVVLLPVSARALGPGIPTFEEVQQVLERR